MSAHDVRSYPIERLHEFTTRVFKSFGVPSADARLAASRSNVPGRCDLTTAVAEKCMQLLAEKLRPVMK